MPWQVPGEQAAAAVPENSAPAATLTSNTAAAVEHHGFPVMIFVVLVIAIIVAIGIFLFANGSLPGT
jgi:hypothetical protein